MSKSIEAFRTIAEVADELGVPKHVLRFWEVKFPQIRPMKRGGGRRFYRPEDLELLRGIQALLHAEAYTIKGVQRILREQGVDQVKAAGRAPAAQAGARGGKKKGAASRQRSAMASPAAAAPQPPPPPAARKVSPAAAAKHAPQRSLSAAGLTRISAVIAELEACRALLSGGAAARKGSAVRAEGRRTRAAR